MKLTLLLLATFGFTSLFAQTKDIYGKFTKGDGTKINGTAVARGFESQVVISNYTGGSDNTATIEIEVPTGAYVSDFRNLMNVAAQSVKTTPTVAAIAKTNIPTSTIKADIAKTNLPATLAQPQLANAEINVVLPLPDGKSNKPLSRIILQDITVVSVTDNIAAGKSIIKLKGNRIGWLYYTYDTGNKISGATKSGWDVLAGASWTNF